MYLAQICDVNFWAKELRFNFVITETNNFETLFKIISEVNDETISS